MSENDEPEDPAAEETAGQFPPSLPSDVVIPEGGPSCNRAPGRSAADVNLDGAPFGFRATGDAAWDPESGDFAMFSRDGNEAVAAMVKTARLMTRSEPEAGVLAWLDGEKGRLKADTGRHERLPRLRARTEPGRLTCLGFDEVSDTMVRETIAYALDEAWTAAYGHRFGEG